jgi:RNase P/RNase MRP subunit POP5
MSTRNINMDNDKDKQSNDTSQKVLLPTLKERQRYVVYKINATNTNMAMNANVASNTAALAHNSPSDIIKHLNDADKKILAMCHQSLGMFDGSLSGLMNIKYFNNNLSGIIRVDTKYVDKLKTVLGLIKNIQGNQALPTRTLTESSFADTHFVGSQNKLIEVNIDTVYSTGMLSKAKKVAVKLGTYK